MSRPAILRPNQVLVLSPEERRSYMWLLIEWIVREDAEVLTILEPYDGREVEQVDRK